MQAMTKREMNLRVFRGEPIPHVFFQPRAEPWFAWHTEVGTMPERFAGLDVRAFYDELDLSMRYVHYYTGMPDPVVQEYAPDVRVEHCREGDRQTIVTHTPHGDLVEVQHFTVDKTWRTVGFPVRGREDFAALRWLLERTRFGFSAEAFRRGAEFVGDRGEPQFWLPKCPYQALCQKFMKLEDFIFALADAPAEVEQVMELVDRTYDPLYEQLCASGLVRIVNFGDNLHEQLLSPAYFERYLLPWYERRVAQLRRAGIYTHVHIDGYFKHMLRYLPALPHDGIEALTPLPQGDMTLEEIREQIGDKVLLDGIPAVLFLPTFSEERLVACVERVIELFHPRLVLGISDELPQGADERAIERLCRVRDMCR